MLRDVTIGSYTNHRIDIHIQYGEWYEYIPKSYDDFTKKTRTIVEGFDPNKLGVRIHAVNATLEFIGKKDLRLSFFSTTEDWVATYWELYYAGYICMGYQKDDETKFQLFAIPEATREHIRKSRGRE